MTEAALGQHWLALGRHWVHTGAALGATGPPPGPLRHTPRHWLCAGGPVDRSHPPSFGTPQIFRTFLGGNIEEKNSCFLRFFSFWGNIEEKNSGF